MQVVLEVDISNPVTALFKRVVAIPIFLVGRHARRVVESESFGIKNLVRAISNCSRPYRQQG
ncbi:hypothetical protein NEIELOOT_00851 [Neisseria elongata subsp. glycolytica ATCC 29315]|uniref:Uncharacterized protein n=1 Tax=Neisseria elongata subsp. glycolytica ATCC 29315 TaxID=546263 RepID=D4DP66_NEIEG|nr:hypothetical protein NEIELOOT_00851 [Neisseria elongata subsp. glycolytica ATCC 29315]